MKKPIALILLIFILLSLFVSCNKDSGNNDSEDSCTNVGKTEDAFAGVDFDGEKLTLSVCNSHHAERLGVSASKYITGLEDDGTVNTHDTIMRPFRERNEYVKTD